ncbi:hypothetical protein R3I93_005921 [Phoxinus phoxinus]|uniref:Uncharacterized protein n=1 Tax=Phoxinus phoxinus TaxID=58324 RepID=A0AAN9HDQ8_9TELE
MLNKCIQTSLSNNSFIYFFTWFHRFNNEPWTIWWIELKGTTDKKKAWDEWAVLTCTCLRLGAMCFL